MVCPVWNGVDTAGRRVCPDSFMTKRAGCNSAEDRVMVENNVSRPQYMEYINLNAAGIALPYSGKLPFQQVGQRDRAMDGMLPNPHVPGPMGDGVTGQFGNGSGFRGETLQGCNGMGSSAGPSAYNSTYPMRDSKSIPYFPSMARGAQHRRQAQAMQEGFNSYGRRMAAGF